MALFVQAIGMCREIFRHIFGSLFCAELLRQTEPHIFRLTPRCPGMPPDEAVDECEARPRVGLRKGIRRILAFSGPAQLDEPFTRLLAD